MPLSIGAGGIATAAPATNTRTEFGSALLALARAAIARRLGGSAPEPPDQPEFDRPAATFVTLKRHGQLRGCIGSLEACHPLRQDLRHNAIAAAFMDPRFPPITVAELADIRIEVSLLGAQQAIDCRSEREALAKLRPGIDGVILECGNRRATFLPQVWESLPDPSEFLRQLRYKAGLDGDYWGSDLHLARYEVEKWQETPPRT